jgi:hypothetical protein
MHRQFAIAMALISMLSIDASVQAKNDENAAVSRPKPFDDVVACKLIENPEQRLACYDEKIVALDQAQQNKEIVVIDKTGMKEAKRGLFGFTLPKIAIFGDGDNADEINEIEAVAESASMSQDGKWFIVLEDGARWQQIDSKTINRRPASGLKVLIRKAAMGSYFVNIDGAPAIRMKRVN